MRDGSKGATSVDEFRSQTRKVRRSDRAKLPPCPIDSADIEPEDRASCARGCLGGRRQPLQHRVRLGLYRTVGLRVVRLRRRRRGVPEHVSSSLHAEFVGEKRRPRPAKGVWGDPHAVEASVPENLAEYAPDVVRREWLAVPHEEQQVFSVLRLDQCQTSGYHRARWNKR